LRQNSNFTIEETISVNVAEIKAKAQGAPLPDQIVYGELPSHYDHEVYRQKAKTIMYKKETLAISSDEHFTFALWFESQCPQEKRQNAPHYAFALSGMGIFPEQQAQCLMRLGIHGDKIVKRRPSADYYPQVLPLILYELLRRIPDTSRKWRVNLRRRARLLALFYQSMRTDYLHGKLACNFALDYMIQWLGTSKETLLADIELFEQYNLLIVTRNGGYPDDNNQYCLLPDYCIDTPYPLVCPLLLSGIKCGTDSPRFDCLPQVQKLYGNENVLLFDRNTHRRRENTATLFQKQGIAAFVHGVPKRVYDTPPPERWHLFRGAKKEIEEEKGHISRKLPTIKVNKNLLEELEREYQPEQLAKGTGDAHILRRLELVEALLKGGVTHELGYTASGRFKQKKGPQNIANPFNTSKTPGRYGYAFWCCIAEPIYETDIRSADVLSGALITKDKKLFGDYVSGDLFARAQKELNLPFANRDLIKQAHYLIQYGGGYRNTYTAIRRDHTITEEQWQKLYEKYKQYLKEHYPHFLGRLADFTKIGGAALKNRRQIAPPNESFFCAEKPHATPAHVIQAVTKIIAARLFNKLEERGYDPVFEIHDAVVTRKEVPLQVANGIMNNIVQDMLIKLELNWPISEEVRFVKTERLLLREAA